jgi:hypothetical protein
VPVAAVSGSHWIRRWSEVDSNSGPSRAGTDLKVFSSPEPPDRAEIDDAFALEGHDEPNDIGLVLGQKPLDGLSDPVLNEQ